jgi:hypothetical protein
MLAVRSNERAAAAAGINVTSTKVLVFGVSSFLAGLAGGLLGYSRGQVSVGSFTALVGVALLAYAYLGGITSVSGALIAGALAPLGIGYVVLSDLLGENMNRYYVLISGIALVVTSVLNPLASPGSSYGEATAGGSRVAARGTTALSRRFLAALQKSASVECLSRSLTVRYGGRWPTTESHWRYWPARPSDDRPNGAGKSTLSTPCAGSCPTTGA